MDQHQQVQVKKLDDQKSTFEEKIGVLEKEILKLEGLISQK